MLENTYKKNQSLPGSKIFYCTVGSLSFLASQKGLNVAQFDNAITWALYPYSFIKMYKKKFHVSFFWDTRELAESLRILQTFLVLKFSYLIYIHYKHFVFPFCQCVLNFSVWMCFNLLDQSLSGHSTIISIIEHINPPHVGFPEPCVASF